MTPTHGTHLSPDQAAYDADQDARIRRARSFANAAMGIALACAAAWAIVAITARRPASPPPAVHLTAPACPACPASPPCAACPACPSPMERRRR